MKTIDSVPLFRTMPSSAKANQQLIVAPPPSRPVIDVSEVDLTDFIGHDVDADEWEALQTECERRHGDDWMLIANSIDTGFRVCGLKAR